MSPTRLIGLTILLRNRLPFIGGWLRRWAIGSLAQEKSPESVKLLAETIAGYDQRTSAHAITALSDLTDPALIDLVCQVWARTRHPALAELLTRQNWVATKPAKLKVLTILQVGQLDELASGRVEVVEPLVQAAEDTDPALAGRARQVLRQLRQSATQERLCRLVIEEDQPSAREAALAAGYVPAEPTQRALFFFLTEQWARYDSLDFDRRLLRVLYQSAAPSLRQRILERLRQAGRTEFLPIITGSDYRTRLSEMQAGELDLLCHTLLVNQAWPELWPLVFELPFCWSGQIVKTLAGQSWRPAAAAEHALFDRLAALSSPNLPADEAGLRQLFPPALLQAEARVPGRINDVAFAPGRPLLAIGTGQGKVALWNFQQAQREHLLRDFNHSIGNVAFNQSNILFCAERTSGGGVCSIYRWDEHHLQRLGQHDESVTALAPVDETYVLSAGRDQRVSLWDASWQREVRQQGFPFWARALRVSPSGREAVLLHEGLTLVTLPELRLLERGPGGVGVARCAAFWPDEQALLVGQFNGQITLLRRNSLGPFKRQPDPWPGSSGRVVGLEVLSQQEIVVCARAEGKIEFRRLHENEVLGQVQAPGQQLTSLHISADESFMAVGNAQAALSLWDLRTLVISGLLAKSFGQASPTQISTFKTFSDYPQLTPPARQVLTFALAILEHRFRYAIELDETPQIKRGEFDIELE